MHFSAIDSKYLEAALLVAPVTILATWIIFKIEHLYDSLWEYASVRELFFSTISCANCIWLIDPFESASYNKTGLP